MKHVIPEGQIVDFIDQKLRKDTPEEYVRQNIEQRLIREHKYNREDVKVEYTLNLGSRKPRADLVIFDKNSKTQTQDDIYIIIECKSESVNLSDKKNGIEQLKSYMAASSNCEWGMWTNSKTKKVFRKIFNPDIKKFEYVEYNDIPSSNGSIDVINRPTRESLIRAVEDNLLFSFKIAHNYIYATDGLQKQPAFFEFLKVIFCKIEDEKNVPNPLEFYCTSTEKLTRDGQLTVKERINSIFETVKTKYADIFSKNDTINLQPSSLSYIVSEFQKYTLLNTNIDIKGRAYEELVGANLRGDRGEFFTPRNVVEMAIKMLNPKHDEKILDPTCGPGGFTERSMTYIRENLKKEYELAFSKKQENWTNIEYTQYQNRIDEIVENNIFGFDINPDLVKAAEMNMLMSHNGTGNFLTCNSLLPPHEWSEEFKSSLADKFQINKSNISSSNNLELFDVILSNPPFGSKIPIKDSNTLSQYDLANIFNKNEEGFVNTERLQSSVPPEILFIERCYQFLKPGGRLAIVLPDAILGSPGLTYIRYWILQKFKLIASVDLHEDAFQPRNGTQTSVLFLQKKTIQEITLENKSEYLLEYNVFMSLVNKIGHDKRGNNIYKKDEKGEEIVNKIEDEFGGVKYERILDDETPNVPPLFSDWKQKEGIIW
ncbi:N-6 DNA methylase [Mammaliicoccus sciuri]|uniref:N-6 DNA methylase n=1 Tax=Mammaliicoccus sciuri TaxID=1296 RepID=UPI001FB42EF0|nr:N-6 DNA methylase [Mammaliicoccus sciuri]MCJ0957405.1 N-6 DNA methylase [Mammaliicoccus sciuri]MCJ1776107.1 N-6 DNA methylase [Mammaliicoccus sciuri]